MTIQRLLSYLRLGADAEDPEVAMDTIERGTVFRGTNLLILVFAIIIASVGLNVNSTAVVIGAMLISPLMGPIMGIGAGLGVRNLWLVRRALKNLGFAVAVSLATSTLYFLVSPLSDAHSEILARTTPTIWDVLIALAGGFAGIIATASKEKNRGNVIPGVAIATALMPPLCTAGYGLAHLNWSFFAGALYLFIINSVFISIAALSTVRWLGYPVMSRQDEKMSRRIKRYTAIIVFITVVPSIWLAYRLVVENAFVHRAEQFIAYETTVPDNYLMDRVIDGNARSITLTYMGNGISATDSIRMHERLAEHGIPMATLTIREGLSLQELNAQQRSKDAGMQSQLEEQRTLLGRLGALTDSLGRVGNFREEVMAEAKAQHPGLQWLAIAELPKKGDASDTLGQVVTAHFTQYPDTAEVALLKKWLDVRLAGQRHVVAITADELKAAPVVQKRRRR